MGFTSMGSLNLVPNPTVMAVQAGLFVANFVVVKKLLLDPYLKVYDKRQTLTVGNKHEAAELVQKNEDALAEIKKKLKGANDEAVSLRNALTSEAKTKKAELIGAAEKKAKESIDDVRTKIQASMKAEMAKIPTMVDELTDVIVKQVLQG